MSSTSASKSAYLSAFYIALVQLLFALAWAVYDIFLPQLASRAGLSADTATLLSRVDLFLVVVMDFAFALAAPRIEKGVSRAAKWIIASVWASCLLFLLLPLVTGGGLLFVVALVWVITSSAIRMPVLILLCQYVDRGALAGFAAVISIARGISGAVGSYLSSSLTGVSPMLPFLVSSLVLSLAVIGVLWFHRQAEGEQPLNPPKEEPPAPPKAAATVVFAVGVFLAAMGFQLHANVMSVPLYKAVAPNVSLDILIPIFWVGFHLALYPGVLLTKRFGPSAALATGAVIGAVGSLSASSAVTLGSLSADQIATGAGFGLFLMAGIPLASLLGAPNRVGAFIAGWSALLGSANFLRAFVFSKGGFSPALPAILWFLGAVVIIVATVLLRRANARQ